MTTSWPHSNACGHRKHLLCPARLFILEEGREVWEGSKTFVPGPLSLRQLHSGDLLRGPRLGAGSPRAEAQWPSPGNTSTVPRQVCLPLPHRASKPSPPDVGSEVINWQGLWGRAPRACAQPAGGVCSLALLDLQISNKELS